MRVRGGREADIREERVDGGSSKGGGEGDRLGDRLGGMIRHDEGL